MITGRTGAGSVFTVTVWIAGVVPTAPVTVKVKTVSAVKSRVGTGTPLVTVPTPLSMVPAPPEKMAVSVVLVPEVMAFFAAVKEAIAGAGGSCWFDWVDPPPQARSRRLRNEAAIQANRAWDQADLMI